MNIQMQRYYGDYNVTKSYVKFIDDGGNTLLACESRELQYVNWKNGEKVPGSSYICMPEGTYRLKVTTDPGNPLCYRVLGATSHRSTKICIDLSSIDDRRHDRILLGFGDVNRDLSRRLLVNKEQCRDRLYKVILQQLQQEEEATLTVINELLK